MKDVSTQHSGVFKVDEYKLSDQMTIEKFRLQNGLKVIILEDHSAPVFAYHTWFNVGSRNERDGITGIAHLFEHLMFKETKNTKEGEFDRILEEQGGKINAGTYLDWTFYRESVPKEAFSLIPPLEADRMANMILSEKQINAEREVVANERRFRVDNSPDGQMQEALYKNAFTVHPYHWPIIGWMKDIQSISVQDCITFYKTYYAPNNATIVVVGDVMTQDVLSAINKSYSHIPSSVVPAEDIPSEPSQEKERLVTLELTIPEEKILIGYKVPDLLNPSFNVMSVINGILFDGHSSRLYRKLVADSSMASEASGSLDHTKDPGLYTIQVSMNDGIAADKALTIIDEEIEKLKVEKVTQEELERAVNRVETSFWASFGTADEKAQNLGFYETAAKDFKKVFMEVELLRKVTPNNVIEAAKTYLQTSKRTIVRAKPKQ
ncbi:MAG: insulinase family protein [Bdellovibrionales bacterium]|nr:insulinase family protein [Bdellovibrionales bacterium]